MKSETNAKPRLTAFQYLKKLSRHVQSFIKRNPKIDYVILFAIGLHVISWFENDYIFLTGDLTLPNISKTLYSWSDAVDGGYPFTSVIWSLWHGFLEVLRIIGLDLPEGFKVYYLLIFFFSGASMYYLTSVLIRHPRERVACMVAALAYMFNPYLFTSFPFLPMYAVLPLTIALYIRGVREGGKQNAFYLNLTLPLLFIGFPNIAFPLLAVGILALYTLYFYKELNLSRFFNFILATLAFFVTVNLWWWLPSLYNMLAFSSPWKTLAEVYLPVFSFSLLSATRWLGVWAFGPSGYYKGLQYFPYINIYLTNPFMIILTFLPPVLAFSAMLLKPKNKHVMFFTCITLISLFLAKGPNPPLGQLYEWILLNLPLSKFFRDTNRIMVIVTVGYSFLIGTACSMMFRRLQGWRSKSDVVRVKKKNLKGFLVVLICGLLLLNSWPLLTGDVIINWYDPAHRGIQIPEFYYDANKWFSNQQDDFRILTLPRLPTYAAYRWGYQGSPIIPQIFSRPLVTGTLWGGTYITAPSFEIVKSIDKMIDRNDTYIARVLGLLNVKYIVIDTSVDTDFYDMPSVNKDIAFLNSTIGISFVRKFDMLLVYENVYFVQHVYSPSNITLLNGSLDSPYGIGWEDRSFSDGWINESGQMLTDGGIASLSLLSNGSYIYTAVGRNVTINPNLYPYLVVRFRTNAHSSIVVYVTTANSSVVYLSASDPPSTSALNHYKSTDWYTLIYKFTEETMSNIASIHILVTNFQDQTYIGQLELWLSDVMFAQSIGSTDDMIHLMEEEAISPYFAVVAFDQLDLEQRSSVENGIMKYTTGYVPDLSFEKLNPARYVIHVESAKPYFLVLLESYSEGWKAHVNGVEVSEHFLVDGYANAWFINNVGKYDVTLEFAPQGILDISIFVSALSLASTAIYLFHRKFLDFFHSLMTKRTRIKRKLSS